MRRLAVISLHSSPLIQPGSGDAGGMNVYVRELVSSLAQAGVECTVYVRRWHDELPDVVDVEIGIPTAGPPGILASIDDAAPGELSASSLPGGRLAITVHRGSYEGLPKAYEELHDWIHAQGAEEGAGPWESYVDDPSEVEISELRTEICWPIG